MLRAATVTLTLVPGHTRTSPPRSSLILAADLPALTLDPLATLVPPATNRTVGRYVRVELPGKDKFLSLAEVQVSALDRGFLFGDSVYEVMRVYQGKTWLLDEHWGSSLVVSRGRA